MTSVKMTQAEYDAYMAKFHPSVRVALSDGVLKKEKLVDADGLKREKKRFSGYRSKWEEEYASILELRRTAGEIKAVAYEAIKLRLANGCYYVPDFLVITNTGEVELHEVKGFFRDKAKVKVKVAVDRFPWWTFFIVRKENRKFTVEKI